MTYLPAREIPSWGSVGRAGVCCDCDAVGEMTRAMTCAHCGSSAVWPLAKWIGRVA